MGITELHIIGLMQRGKNWSDSGDFIARDLKTAFFMPFSWLSPRGLYFLQKSLLLDLSPIIGCACHSLPNSLTNFCLVNLIDVTLACEDAYSKIVEVADVDDENRVGNSLLQIWKLRLVKKLNFSSDFEHKFGQDFEVEVKGRFEAGVWSVVFCWCIVEVIKLNLGRDSEAWFGQYF